MLVLEWKIQGNPKAINSWKAEKSTLEEANDKLFLNLPGLQESGLNCRRFSFYSKIHKHVGFHGWAVWVLGFRCPTKKQSETSPRQPAPIRNQLAKDQSAFRTPDYKDRSSVSPSLVAWDHLASEDIPTKHQEIYRPEVGNDGWLKNAGS